MKSKKKNGHLFFEKVLKHTFFGEREVKLDECWAKKKSYETSDGYKIMYYCSMNESSLHITSISRKNTPIASPGVRIL